ncbi:prepilin peptidase [Candidatus Saccharibacteria bacterium]|nr:prepilin peptidase [Candidatus Saccharibacteria bacterium]
MNDFIIYLSLAILGMALGSFSGATVWRLRARQLQQDKDNGERVNHEERLRLNKIINRSFFKDRSKCLHCSYQLEWFDMIPIVSWLALKGRCRECHQKIGYMEPLLEFGLAAFFVISFAVWPYSLVTIAGLIRLILWLAAGVGLAILFAYDLKWFLLPNQANFFVIGIGVLNSLVEIINSHNIGETIFNIFLSVVILSGLYFALHLMSKGKWIGFGDVKLGFGLGLMLIDWRLSLLALFAANFIGSVIVLPGLLMGRLKRSTHIPFGPLLITGFVLAGLFGGYIIAQYFLPLA